ncbi:hypothetical protein MXD62_19240 [Frankia sp. Mgl5]|uniref:hypothetical protein n=1 Tax=Frankia sp. Mgl5 TaxID=2933793 RepID=UPI00200C0F3C|nr:hypothetical protein [Frankia sp. Mgl5]MCK9929286.1 hypothetical protein [Frankia sp. Mgl5]
MLDLELSGNLVGDTLQMDLRRGVVDVHVVDQNLDLPLEEEDVVQNQAHGLAAGRHTHGNAQ